MPVPWEYYVKRRNIDVAEYIRKNGCETYEDLVGTINKFDIVPPTREQVKEHFKPKPAPRKKPVQKATAKPAKPAARKVSASRAALREKAKAKKAAAETVVETPAGEKSE
jgi:hypothetical protein